MKEKELDEWFRNTSNHTLPMKESKLAKSYWKKLNKEEKDAMYDIIKELLS